ncbi:MAG: hypothetical protein WAV32_05745 [Halobacteriota archaeon]
MWIKDSGLAYWEVDCEKNEGEEYSERSILSLIEPVEILSGENLMN